MDFRDVQCPDLDPVKMPASTEELVALVEDQAKWITTCLGSPQDSWMPSLFVRCRWMKDRPEGGDILHALAVPFNTDSEKREVMERIGRELFSKHSLPSAAVLTSEAWLSKRPECAPRIQPKDDPDRTEVIIIMASSLGGERSALCRIPVTRGARNVLIPGKPDGVFTDGVRSPLLNHLWRGFFEHVRTKFGIGGSN